MPPNDKKEGADCKQCDQLEEEDYIDNEKDNTLNN